YAFTDTPEGGGKPKLDLRPVDAPFDLFGRKVEPVPLWHGELMVYGYRIGDFAYCTDCNRIPESSRPRLSNLEVLVLDALRPTPPPTHFSLPETLSALAELQPRRAYLVHMGHDLDHEETERSLPPSIRLAHDGLVLEL